MADQNNPYGTTPQPLFGGNPQSVEGLYQKYLGRAPEAEGLAYWQQQFGSTIDPNEIAAFRAVADANISKGIEQGPGSAAAITNLYQQYLGRAPEAEGLAYWQQQFGPNLSPEEAATFKAVADANISKGIEQGPETSAAIANLYQQYLGRAADPEGMMHWKQQFGTNLSPEEAATFQKIAQENLDKGIEKGAAYYSSLTPTTVSSSVEDLYLQDKLQQLANDPQALQLAKEIGWTGKTTQELKDFMQSFGMTPYQHYQKYGKQEGVDWRKQNLEDVYLEKKLAQLANDPNAQARAQELGWTGGTPEELKSFMQSLGLSPFEYYQKYGLQEGLQFSGFDAFGNLEGQPQQAKLEGILSGFEALGKGEFTEDQVKNFIGKDKFNEYKDQFGGALKSGIANILADNSLSGQEVMSAVQTARKYGLDNDEISNLTGYDKSLFDEINKGYDTTVNSLVDKALEGKEDLGGKVKTNLALQLQYGLTDEDLAKASDTTTDQIKGLLDPVRDFGSKYESIANKAGVSGKDILSFLDSAKKNDAVSSVYGDKINQIETKITDLNNKWGGYDGLQAQNIYDQINSVTNTLGGKNWTGSWSGQGGDSAMKAAVGVLMDKGVTNLANLKVQPQYVDAKVSKDAFYNGSRVRTDESGRKYIYFVDPNNDELMRLEYLPPGAKTTPGVQGWDVEGGFTDYRPMTAEELKTYNPKTNTLQVPGGKNLVDSSTGKVIATSGNNDFEMHSYETGDFWKSENKRFAIRMTDQGVPIPYQTTEKDGFLYSPAFPFMASILLPGAGKFVSNLLPGAGVAASGATAAVAPTLLNQALTQGILSGSMAALTGGDVLKSALVGAAGAPISTGISNLLPTGINPNLARMATNIGTTAATSALAGRPMNLQGALINAGVQYGAQQLPWNLSPQQVNLLAGVATPYLQGQSISPTQLTGILANYALKSQQPQKGAR